MTTEFPLPNLRSVLACVAVLSGVMMPASAADGLPGDFERHSIRFTGGDYKDEEFHYAVLPPATVKPGEEYPLIFFLHGAGERGNDPGKLLVHFPTQMAQAEWREKFPCYIVMPQCRDNQLWMQHHWSEKESKPLREPTVQMQMAMAVLEQALTEFPIDHSRVYLTGLSMGGFGSWELAMRRPELFAAVAPVCGGGDESQAHRLKEIPIWTAHGDADGAVWVGRTRRMVDAIQKAGGQVRYTEMPGVGHNSWTPFYSQPDGVVAWMFQQQRKSTKP